MPSSAKSVASGASKPATKTPARKASPAKSVVDLAVVDGLLGAIYEGPTESPPWNSALQRLRDTLAAAHVTLILRPPSQDSTGVMINTGPVTTQGVESYETHFFSMDPFVRLQEGQVATAEELIGKQWLDSAIYQEYLRPLGVRHLLGADIYTKEGIECRLRVTRAQEAKAFSAGDKALVSFLLPHLKRSIQLHARLDLLETERQLFAGTVNRMLLGIVSFDQNGAIIETNQEARRILAEKDGIWLSGNTIGVDSGQEGRELQRMIRQAVAGGIPEDGNHPPRWSKPCRSPAPRAAASSACWCVRFRSAATPRARTVPPLPCSCAIRNPMPRNRHRNWCGACSA
jgi:PAS domain-containing protein